VYRDVKLLLLVNMPSYIYEWQLVYIQLLNWQLLNCIYNMAIIMKLCGTVM